MIFGHPTDETLFAFADNELSTEEREGVEAHLKVCTSCTQAVAELREIVALTSDPVTWEMLDHVSSYVPDPERVRDFAERAERKVLEDRDAAGALRELQKLPLNGWRPWLHARRWLLTAGMVAALLAEARKRVQTHPRESLRIVTVASDVAQMLTDQLDRPVMLGLVANERATAFRFLGQNAEALRAVEEAAAKLEPIGSAPDEKARVAWNRATVLFALERYREAHAALDGPKDWFRSIGDEIELARIGILEGSILHDEGDRAAALAVFTQVAQILETRPEQPDLAVVYANMAFCHLALGDLATARMYGKRAITTYEHVEMLSERIRTRWMFAQLLIESGNVDEGLTDLRAAALEYEAAGMVADAAQVDLERVEVLLRVDRWVEAASIARRLVTVYERGGQRLSHVQALAYLREAVDATTATPELARYVRGYLGDQAHPPFRPPATPFPS